MRLCTDSFLPSLGLAPRKEHHGRKTLNQAKCSRGVVPPATTQKLLLAAGKRKGDSRFSASPVSSLPGAYRNALFRRLYFLRVLSLPSYWLVDTAGVCPNNCAPSFVSNTHKP